MEMHVPPHVTTRGRANRQQQELRDAAVNRGWGKLGRRLRADANDARRGGDGSGMPSEYVWLEHVD